MRDLPIKSVDAASRFLEPEPEHNYFCRHCGTIITSDSRRVERDGAFRHTFTNPAGVSFIIGCFAEAAGCAVVGDHSKEYTWFSGYQWSYALCCGCASHLGWHYKGRRRAAFFGLILDQLIEP